MTIAMLPSGTTPAAITGASGAIAAGVLSPGLGAVPTNQTYLDISQGNRLFDSLYPSPIGPLPLRATGVASDSWQAELRRAAGAPAQIEPGLLPETLAAAGVPAAAAPGARQAALIVVEPDGSIDRAQGCRLGSCPGLTLGTAKLSELPGLVAGMGEGDLLIALERPPPAADLVAGQ